MTRTKEPARRSVGELFVKRESQSYLSGTDNDDMDDIVVSTTTSHSSTIIGTKVTPVEEPIRVREDEMGVDDALSSHCGISCVEGYYVKDSVAPILEAIFKKHGDIAAECLFKSASVRSFFLEVVCEVVKQIQSNNVSGKMEDLECKVSDAEAANVNVSWLRPHLDAIHKQNVAMEKSNLLMELKVNTILVKRDAPKGLRESCSEPVGAQQRYRGHERGVGRKLPVSVTNSAYSSSTGRSRRPPQKQPNLAPQLLAAIVDVFAANNIIIPPHLQNVFPTPSLNQNKESDDDEEEG
ncbi:uncharacterized protein [Rutidosis leptorrhynchoides]|uniref:uncharacterized protein n=1 Tax=Rutidosis leptorrhynchoides TaxID=125765 RepID=UPI003A99CEDC